MPADPERSVRRQACVYRRGIQTCAFAYRQNSEHTSGLRPRFNYQTYRWEIKTLTCRAGNGGDARGAHADQHACTQQMTGGGAHGIRKHHTEERNRRRTPSRSRRRVLGGGVTNSGIKDDSFSGGLLRVSLCIFPQKDSFFFLLQFCFQTNVDDIPDGLKKKDPTLATQRSRLLKI